MVALVTVGVWWWEEHPAAAVAVTASASADGTDPAALLEGELGGGGAAVWRSEAPGVGQWLQLDYASPTELDRVRVAPAGADQGVRAALLVFDAGASLLVHAGSDGAVDVSFPARRASSVRVVVAEAAADGVAVALSGLRLDNTATSRPTPLGPGDPREVTTSSGDGGAALVDGDPASGDAGAAWTAAGADPEPSVAVAWGAARTVASVQVLGPAAGGGSDQPAVPALSGVLRFDDGSSVVVSGVEASSDQPTTVAFSPRVASRVVLELRPSTAGTPVGLREVSVQGEGTTPPVWPATGPGHTVEPAPADCSAALAGGPTGGPQPSSAHPVVLLCPSVGSAVGGSGAAEATIVVGAAPGSTVTASAAPVGGDGRQRAVSPVASAVADAQGRAALTFSTDDLPAGPTGVQVEAAGSPGGAAALRVPLVNLGGKALTSQDSAPRGMTLQWSDDFEDPLPASVDGAGAVYAARKPTVRGGESFGDAGFGDPGAPSAPLASLPESGGYLRMRADDGSTSGSRSASLLSSLRVGAGGFGAQYGYFEARMLGGPGTGSWPAFWALNTQSATADDRVAGEADAVELYGHNTRGSCHSTHDYSPDAEGGDDGTFTCLDTNGFPDWSLTWHTYGMRVTPDAVTFFVDGQQVAEQQRLGRSQEPFFFLLDQALGGGWPVDLSPTSGLTDTYVDWVRVYT